MNMMGSLLDRYEAMDASKQRMIKLAGALLVMLAVVVVVKKFTAPAKPKVVNAKTESTVMTPSRADVDVSTMYGKVYNQDRTLESLERKQETLDRELPGKIKAVLEQEKESGGLANPEAEAEVARLRAQVAQLEAERGGYAPSVQSPADPLTMSGKAPSPRSALPDPRIRNGVQPSPGATGNGLVGAAGLQAPSGNPDEMTAMPAAEGLPTATAVPSEPDLCITTAGGRRCAGDKTSASDSASANSSSDAKPTASGSGAGNAKEDRLWLPAGSIVQGVLLSGVDAPTSGHAMKNPTPVLIRIKHEAILPNRFKMDLRECFIIASGHGVMSTERADLRTNIISCTRKDGGVIETSLEGYLVGDDGKAGLRGRLVTKQGAMIARSMVAGFFGGLANAAKPSAIGAIQTSPGSTTGYQSPEMETAIAAGLGTGAASALTEVSKFYLDMAKEMFPVVEVDAGRNVEIVIVRGTGLPLKGGNQPRGTRPTSNVVAKAV